MLIIIFADWMCLKEAQSQHLQNLLTLKLLTLNNCVVIEFALLLIFIKTSAIFNKTNKVVNPNWQAKT